jgi:hypothetical protein
MVGTVREPRIGSVRFDAKELHVNERVKHPLAQRPLDTTETLRLFAGQAQPGHFQKLGTEAIDHCVVRHATSQRLML